MEINRLAAVLTQGRGGETHIKNKHKQLAKPGSLGKKFKEYVVHAYGFRAPIKWVRA